MRCVVCDGGLRAAVRDAAGYTLELLNRLTIENKKENTPPAFTGRTPARDSPGHVAVRGGGGGGLEYESGRTGRHRAWSGHLLFPLSVPAATRHGLPNEAIAAFANCTNSKPQPSAFQAQQGWGGDSSRCQRAGDRHGDACFGRVQNASPRCMTAGLTPGACVQIEAT